MADFLRRLFRGKAKKDNAKAPLNAPTQKKTNNSISLTKFIELNPQLHIIVSDIRAWYLIKGYIKKIDSSEYKNVQFRATNLGKSVGINSQLINRNNITRTAIYINENAQALTLEHFLHQDISSVIQNLDINDPYFDTILSKIDTNIKLDQEQRQVVVETQKNTLVVAGAGSGKTTTMAAKVKYLVERQTVKPEEIIIISYTNKAIQELRERINGKLEIPVNIATFHAFAFDIVKKTYTTAPQISYSSYKYLSEYLEKVIFDDQEALSKLILFLGYYFNLPEDIRNFKTLNDYIDYKARQDYETLKSNLATYNKSVMDQRSNYKKTILGEYLRSHQEVQIANFLYLHNIDYIYEPIYPITIPNSHKPYTPDFLIKQGELEVYLEHFGISEDYQYSLYSRDELQKYVFHIQFKRKVHATNNTTLLETFSTYKDGRDLLSHLSELLRNHGFTLKQRPDKEVYEALIKFGKDSYIQRFIFFLKEFIELYKTDGYFDDGFDLLRKRTDNDRTLLFLDIAEGAYHHYQSQLQKYNQIDFADMINQASAILSSNNLDLKLPYKYIIIDEFQDIARQRFNFTRLLAQNTNAHIVAVGDDWQSIFAFAGSDITLFTRFIELIGEGVQHQISNTYRNSQELIDVAGRFIQKNSNQIVKSLKSPKHLIKPIEVVEYDDSVKLMKSLASKTADVIGSIIRNKPDAQILMLGRYNFDAYKLSQSGEFDIDQSGRAVCKRFPQAKLSFMTVHSAKGLGYDEVILVNLIEGMFGFPSQIESDPIMKLVVHEENSVPFAEERRLFYVAMTRTKNRLFMMVPQNKPSRFAIEIIQENNLPYSVQLNLNYQDKARYRCPKCNSPLKYSPNNPLGIKLYICTNEPELCSFMTNEPSVMQDITKCTQCDTGYMIVKKLRNDKGYVIGCTNYTNPEVKCSCIRNL